MKKTLYNLAFVVILALFGAVWIPFGEKLNGVTDQTRKVEFNLSTVFLAEYQDATSKRFSENVAAKPFLVRLHNQIMFNLFSEGNSDVVVGHNHVLFEKSYLDEYADNNPLNSEELKKKLDELEAWTNRIKDAGVQPYLMIVPSKTEYYQKAIPQPWSVAETTNIDRIHAEIQKRKLPLIDLRKISRSLQDTSKFSVFPKYGIHWSRITSFVSLTHFFNIIDTISDESHYVGAFDNVRKAPTYSDRELDIGKLLNLLYDLEMDEAIGQLDLHNEITGKKLGLLVIGDSFYWSWYGNGYTTTQFEPSYFFYYNSTAYKAGEGEIGKVSPSLQEEALKNVDVAVIMLTEANWALVDLFGTE